MKDKQITRRSFISQFSLTAAYAVIAFPCLSSCRPLDENLSVTEKSFALLSDTHVTAHPDQMDYYYPPIEGDKGINLNSCFKRVTAELVALKSELSSAIICGDCARNNGSEEEYIRFRNIAEPLHQAGIQLYPAMGNHDNFENFNKIMSEPSLPQSSVNSNYCYVVKSKNVNWFVLDSSSGVHGSDQHKWLGDQLDKNPNKPALLVTHYPLLFEHEKIEHPFIDSTLADTDELFEIITDRKQVKAVFVGHWHLWYLAKAHGIHIISLPSVSSSFRPVDPSGWVHIKTKDDAMTLTLNHSNPRNGLHKDHGKNINLKWRTN
ncbi:metallophosphoesterase family protein [Planctomycetota bacterium]